MPRLLLRPMSPVWHVHLCPRLLNRRSFYWGKPQWKQAPRDAPLLRGSHPPERSIRVLSKEQMRLPSDFGILEGTFITPTGPNRPSILQSPAAVLTLERTRISTRARDFVSLLVSKFSSPQQKGLWDRTFNLDRSTIVPTATALHHQMYTAFAEGDTATLKQICLDGIYADFVTRIANRSPEEKVVWELLTYHQKAKLVSNRAAKTPLDGMVIRQAVVRISSRQKLSRYTRTRNGQLVLIPGSGKEKDQVENVVIQNIYQDWKPRGWTIWGTTEETTLEDVEKWNEL
ncbi:hypothetical protein K3495_g4314 [Podosphaera aphanis]|nr:hypothetical protein K3495_g4314 [Podosphaera aphanis]